MSLCCLFARIRKFFQLSGVFLVNCTSLEEEKRSNPSLGVIIVTGTEEGGL